MISGKYFGLLVGSIVCLTISMSLFQLYNTVAVIYIALSHSYKYTNIFKEKEENQEEEQKEIKKEQTGKQKKRQEK